MQIPDGPGYFFHYKFRTRPPAEGRQLPVSKTYPGDNPWITIPWDEVIDDPEGALATPGGWTFLYGPCVAIVQGEVGLMEVQQQATTHIGLYQAQGDGATVAEHNAWEWEIAAKETHSAHLDGNWVVHVPNGNRLRMSVDYWHATKPARITRANVSGVYWRL